MLTGAVRLESFELTGSDDRPIRGDLHRADVATAGVVLCHGFKGSGRLSFFPHLARSIAQAGMNAVTFDFTGSGIGPDRERFVDADAFAHDTFARELFDLEVVLQAGAERGWLGARGPGLLGFSRGGGVAILRAAADRSPEIGALVTWSSIANVNRWSAEERQAWHARGYREVSVSRDGPTVRVGTDILDEIEAGETGPLNVLDAAARVAEHGIPWLIVHGTADQVVGVHEARQLHTASGDRAELALIESANHGYGTRHGAVVQSPALRAAVERTVRFLRANLQ